MKHSLIEPLEARIAPALFLVDTPAATPEGNDLTQHDLIFVVRLPTAMTTLATVDYTTLDGTGANPATVADNDYAAVSGTLIFPAGETQMTVRVPIFGDAKFENAETFRFRISNATGGAGINLLRQTAIGTISNDDLGPTPTVSIDSQSFDESDAGFSARFFATLSNESLSTVTVAVTTAGNTATSGVDFTANTQTLTFAPGERTKEFNVAILPDAIHEGNETYFVNLSSPVNATLGTAQGIGTITDDDPVPTISITGVTTLEGNSGTSNASFTITLSGASSDTITLTATALADTLAANPATAGSDFTARSQTFTFSPGGALTQTFNVPILGDTIDELDEVFSVDLSNITNATAGVTHVAGTITDDDTAQVTVADVSRVEGNVDTTLTFTVALSTASDREVRVNFETQDGTAISTGTLKDFDALTGELIFAPGVTTRPVTITIHGDTLSESDESFLLKLTAATNATIIRTEATGTILNDEPSLRIDDVQIVEGDSGEKQAVFTVTLDNAPLTGNVTVDVRTEDGTATVANNDYTAFPLTALTFLPGQTTKQIIVPIVGDRNVEGNEQFSVRLSNVSPNAAIGRGTGTGTILSDDSILRIGDARIAEGASGTREAVFTVSLENGPLTGDVAVNFTTQDGTALSAGDYAAQSGTLTFSPDQTSREVRVLINGDNTPEQNETFSVKITSPNAILADDTGMGTILNDDGSFFTINDVAITEGDSGFSNLVFLVQLSAAAGQAVTLSVNTVPGTALSGGAAADFTAVTTTLTFNASDTQKLVSVPIRGDLIREGAETFSLLLSNVVVPGTAIVTILDDTGIGTILDNNDPVPTVSIGNAVAGENAGTMRFTAMLSQPSPTAVTASYSTQNDLGGAHPATIGSDYTAISNGTITFAPGETMAFIDIPITGDTVDEFDETFGLTLSSPVGATLGTAEALGTIQNDEVTISVNDVSIFEGNSGTTAFTFEVTISQAPVGHSVVVNYASINDTASSTGINPDFASKTGSLTFAAGGPTKQTVTILMNGDARFEKDQQFFLDLSSPANATIVDGRGVGTILDDDPVTISIQDASIAEGSSGNNLDFNVTLDHASDLPISVTVNTANGTALASVTTGTPPNTTTTLNDYTAIVGQTITFAAGDQAEMVRVSVIDDTDDEVQKTFTVNLSGATNDATLLDGMATGTINDDDLRILSVADVTLIEGDSGTKPATFRVSLDRAAKLPVTFDFATANGSAIAGQDYLVPTNTTLTIPAGTLFVDVPVTVNGDTTVEGNEVFFLNLSNAVNGKISATAGQGKATIVDDEAKLQLTPVGGLTVGEDGGTTAEFVVVRSGDFTQAVTVQYETTDVTTTSTGALADYVAKTGTISFAAGSSRASGTIKIAITGDSNYENDETFNVRLFNPVNAAVLDNADVARLESSTPVTITDNDDAPTLSIIGPPQIVEGNTGTTQTATFTVRLSAANERDIVTVKYATADGTANSAASTATLLQDYVRTPAILPTLTFQEGITEQTFTITINGDNRDESDAETFQVNLSGEDNADVVVRTATATIADNDEAPTLSFSGTGTFSVNEGNAGMTNATVTLSLSEVSEREISVKFKTKDGTAVSTGSRPDFPAIDDAQIQTATFAAGTARNAFTFTIPVFGDLVDEVDETFTVILSEAVNARLIATKGTVQITDDDPTPVISVNNVTLAEGNAGTTDMVFTVSLSGPSEKAVSVHFNTPDATSTGLATSTGPLADYIATSGTLNFAPGETQKEIRVKIIGDVFKETDETFSVTLDTPVNGTIVAGAGTGTGTILTEQSIDTTIGIGIRDAFRVEGNPTDASSQVMAFTVELSIAASTPTTFTVVSTNGTAVRGQDFGLLESNAANAGIVNQIRGTIVPNALSTTVSVRLANDGAFEPTESYFLSLRNVASGGDTFGIAGGSARGTIFNDDLRQVNNHTIQFIDVDGDLATVHVSRGPLTTDNLRFGAVNANTGGRQLQVINFTGDTRFQDTDLTVSARRQPGFNGSSDGVKGNGHVNVGAIFAAAVRQEILQVINGIDFGIVTIDGDLGKIHVGDIFATPAIDSLVVRSMGRFGNQTQGGTGDTFSLALGPIDNLHVSGNFAGRLEVTGAQFGTINNLHIGGDLLGGSTADSGRIGFTGNIRDAFIGRVVGGDGSGSGILSGSPVVDSKIKHLRVGGFVSGGSGANSGVITATTIQSLTIGGLAGGSGDGDNLNSLGSGVVTAVSLQKLIVRKNIVGGEGDNSGQVIANSGIGTIRVGGEIRGGVGQSSGLIFSQGGASHISVFGSIIGGSGPGSGRIQVSRTATNLETGALVGGSGDNSGKIGGATISNLSVNGDIVGGSGNGSGGVDLTSRLLSGSIGGDIVGGDSGLATALVKSGYVIAHQILDLTVGGDLKSGTDAGGGLALSGTIRSETRISSLHIKGSVLGSENVAAIIAAPGTTKNAAIQTLNVNGEARFAEILAGYGASATVASVRGAATNSDAQIGKVRIDGDVRSSSIIAGVDSGRDGLFGTTDDIAIGGTGTINSADAVSKIAKIVIGGTVRAGERSSGIEAQFVETLSVKDPAFSLTNGPGNDGVSKDQELVSGSNISVFEVPVV